VDQEGVVIIPAVHGVVTLRPFVGETATLTSALHAQVTALAGDVKANHDTKIAIVGFSGDLTTAKQKFSHPSFSRPVVDQKFRISPPKLNGPYVLE
jgi:hypothetical protein